jgi:hypothetical protein
VSDLEEKKLQTAAMTAVKMLMGSNIMKFRMSNSCKEDLHPQWVTRDMEMEEWQTIAFRCVVRQSSKIRIHY